MEKTQNQAHFSKIPIQNIRSNLYGKNEKTAFTEMNYIQKRRKILPNCDRCFKDEKDESPIFLTSITMSQKVQEVLTFLISKMAKNGQNRDFLPILGQIFSN
jgi:hypothetical protein